MPFTEPSDRSTDETCDCQVAPPGPGAGRFVVVQTEPGEGARDAMLATLQRQPVMARGVAMVSLITPEATLEQMALTGVRGLRLAPDPRMGPDAAIDTLGETALRAARRGWLVELDAPMAFISAMRGAIGEAPAPVVLTGLASSGHAVGLEQPGLDTVLELLAAGRVWVKLCGSNGRGHALAVLRALMSTNANQLVWGSNWPTSPADAGLEQLAAAAYDRTTLIRILRDNPAQLYGFGSSDPSRVVSDGMTKHEKNFGMPIVY